MFQVLLKKIAEKFERQKIPYMIIGGQAVLKYGEPRLTRDIDITLGFSVDKFELIEKIVNELNLRILTENATDFVRKTMVLPTIEDKTQIRVDFIFSFTPFEQQAINRTKSFIINETEVRFISIEDLIIQKVFSGRERDLEDVEKIILKNSNIDFTYIRNWLEQFSATMQTNYGKVLDKILKV